MTNPTSPPRKPASYADAGVDIEAGNRLVDLIGQDVAATQRSGSLGAIGGFGGLFDPAAAGYRDPILVAATDGVGTKLRIAIETGQLGSIGIDLVAMCVNDLVVQGAEPLFFLDYYATGRLDPNEAAAVVSGIAKGCREAGAALIGGETAEMPGLYAGRDFDLAGFSVGAVERDRILPRTDIAEGDHVLGLASSGLHSNGYSLVRKLVADGGFAFGDAAPFDDEMSLGEVLLTPTRIYVKPLLAAIRETGAIKALAHITGGGLMENLPRVLPDGLGIDIDATALAAPAEQRWLAKCGAMEPTEFLRTFNGGIGMAVIAAPGDAEALVRFLADAGERVTTIGQVVTAGPDARVTLSGALNLS